ncbi:hypothetical protein O6H91_18G024300 [Diphasiastrum complanatum]|uniref:Uncharacterized protein n=4 Tax=Diphasiastrum complanatum TaxID=34168 RepID=A0ACC2AYX6_DIPCM|nr:hypothetical protein O6H91_18G024300 [Diphasiastrum complanatum]KAJ7522728.1 hypothetical protein O6H91_18G024300 [Diphasiastrum complanatum]KAJ7522729.1 hypothetical protein O6H91_18G024300 [Diphasiastrum complanatum]KAJ7522730.1 hypothetical protein O6H91_18G024300 [Diphasiastrum complanatum]
MGGKVVAGEFQMISGSAQVQDSKGRVGYRGMFKMGLNSQGSMNGKSSYFLERTEDKKTDSSSAFPSDSGATCLNANVGSNVDSSFSKASKDGIKYLNPNNVENGTNVDHKVGVQLPKESESLEDKDREHSENGILPDLPPRDDVQVRQVPPEDQNICEDSNQGVYLSTEFLQMSPDSCTHRLPPPFTPLSHDGKQILLDPNAREFTPSPSPFHTHPLSSLSISVPFPLSDENPLIYRAGVDIGAVVYNSDLNNGCPSFPVFGSSGLLGYGPTSNTQSPWNAPPLKLVLQAELSQHSSVPVPALPPPPCEQEYRANYEFQRNTPLNITTMDVGTRTHAAGMPAPPTIIGREHVSRALLLSGVPTEINNIQLRCELEQWGPVRALRVEKRNEGVVTVCYFDLRNAKDALKDIQQQHLLQQQRIQQHLQLLQRKQQQSNLICKHENELAAHHDANKVDLGKFEMPSQGQCNHDCDSKGLIGGKAVWAQYTVPFGSEAGPDGMNQGTLVVFNLDADVSHDALRAAFEVHGPVKELRETPARRQHKFVEFFDIRDAARALAALDGKEVCGKRVKIEFSRPGGQARRARVNDQAQVRLHMQQGCPPSSGSRAGPSLSLSHVQGQQLIWGWNGDPAFCQSHSFQCPPQAYMCSNFGPMASAAPLASLSYVAQHWNGPEVHPQLSGYGQQSLEVSPTASALLPVSEVRPFSAGNERCFGNQDPLGHGNYGAMYGGLNKGSIRGADLSGRRGRLSSGTGFYFHSSLQDSGEFRPVGFGGTRYSHQLGKPSLASKNARDIVQTRYVFDEFEAVSNSSSPRTTLMIRNIPNKYSQQMLLDLLDQHCLRCNKQIVDPNEALSAYDFVYLPIDFKNKCNLGYAFVNFTTVEATVRLYKAFHSQQWEAFNSRKICQVTYARVQGKSALEEHFRNSRFNCEIDEYLPLVFSPPRTGIECPAPTVAVCSSSSSVQENHGNHAQRDNQHGENVDEQSSAGCKWS